MTTRVELPPPPPITFESGGGGGDWVELVRARDDIDASLLVGRLSEAGIESRSLKDAAAPTWMYGGRNPWAPVVVWVRWFELDNARLVLAEVALSSPSLQPQVVGTSARSRPVPLGWWVTALVLGALVSAAVLIDAVRSLLP